VLRADYVANKRNGGGLLGYSYDDSINGIGRGVLEDGSFAKGEGTGSNRWALSLGMNYLYDENTIFKLEFRHDGANQPVFANQKGLDVTGYRKSNQLLGASVVVKF
jgi:long-subunit fatty acid transport protein